MRLQDWRGESGGCRVGSDLGSALRRTSVPGLFLGSPPRLGAGTTGNSRTLWVITAWWSCWALDHVYHVVLEINARVTWQLKSPLQSKPVFYFVPENSPAHWGMWLRLSLPFWAHLKSSTNLIQYVHCKPINQGRLALGRKRSGFTGTHVCKWFCWHELQQKRCFHSLCISPSAVGPHIGRYCGQKTWVESSGSSILSMVFYTDSAIAKVPLQCPAE